MNRNFRRSMLTVIVGMFLIIVFWPPGIDIDANLAEKLTNEADELCAKFDGEIPIDAWPDEIAKLKPEFLRIREEGLYIRLRSFFVTESGLFVLRRASKFNPQSDGDPFYRLLYARVYRYRIEG
jgi:hypothetical protein